MSILQPVLRPVLQPLSLSLTRAGVPIWTPRRLYAAGEQGAWYDPSDFSTLYQDSAGTTPVTAVGQPVGLLKDKSGRGNHASQSTTTARPTLQQDSGGRYYLSFDGVDDYIDGSAFGTGLPQPNYLTAAAQAGALGVDILNSISSTARNSLSLASGGLIGVYAGTATATAGLSVTVGQRFVAAGLINGASSMIRLNGAEASSTTNAGSEAYGGARIGTNAGRSLFFNGRIYGCVVLSNAITSANRQKLERYLASKSGVTL